MKKFYTLLLGIAFVTNLIAQHDHLNCDHSSCGLQGIEQDMFSFVPPPDGYEPFGPRDVVISVTYNGFTAQAQAAFQYAVDIWASTLTSTVPIQLEANWENIPGNTLGFAGAIYYYPNPPGATFTNTYYPAALANKLAGSDLVGNEIDITATFDSGTSWYFGTDGNTPAGQYDFVTVVLHELCHGLGMLGSADYNGGVGSFFFHPSFDVYDRFVENTAGTDIVTFGNNTASLGSQLVGNGLYWNGAFALGNNAGTRPRLYAPGTWSGGSSYAHLNESTYPAGDINSLMTPFVGTAEAIHNPGPIIEGIMQDIGWTLAENNGDCVYYTLTIDTDCWGEEVSWELRDSQNNIVQNLPVSILGDLTTYEFDICLEAGQCYTFNIFDDFGDGLNGASQGSCGIDGDYFMTDDQGNLVFSMANADYGFGTSHSFCTDAGSGDCLPSGIEATFDCVVEQNSGDLLPAILISTFFDGNCFVDEVCVQGSGDALPTCYALQDFDIFLESGDGVIVFVDPNDTYEVWFTVDGSTSVSAFVTVNTCTEITGCTNPFAANFNPDANVEDGSCTYNATVCDCVGTEHTIGVLVWIGDGFADDGAFDWDGQPVDFNCSSWGFDCGDIDGAPNSDPNGVCDGNLPPNNGCGSVVPGCTNPEASNFNPSANEDNGSCNYPDCVFYEDFEGYGNGDFVAVGSTEITTWSGTEGGPEDAVAQAGIAANGEMAMRIEQTVPNVGGPDDLFIPFGQTTGTYFLDFDLYIYPGSGGYYNVQETTTPGDGWAFEILIGAGGTVELNIDGVIIGTGSIPTGTWTSVSHEINLDANTATISVGTLNQTIAFNTALGGLNFFAFGDAVNGLYLADNVSLCGEQLPGGCTDPGACNFDPDAVEDDGSCEYLSCAGCMDPEACNYDPGATIDSGCEYLSCAGCTDAGACNYDATATIEDGSCEYESCLGCTDETAVNFDEDALIDDGSCIYECIDPAVTFTTFCLSVDDDNYYVTVATSDLGNGAPYTISNSLNATTQSITQNGNVVAGPFPNNANVVLTVSSNELNCAVQSGTLTDDCAEPILVGCTDPLATNYVPTAIEDDGSCEYDFNICDCDLVVWSPAFRFELGDGNPNAGGAGPNFNCDVWGYDCGDVAGSPDFDPFGVCDGNLPLNNGCIINVDEQSNFEWSIYPNPSDGSIRINTSGFNGLAAVRVFDMQGRLLVDEQHNVAPVVELNFTGRLAAGSYILELSADTHLGARIIVIE